MFAQTLVAALVALPFVVQSAVATDCSRSYNVMQGDICDSISAANNVSTYQLAAMNPQIDSECGNLIPGQTLCLGGAESEDCKTTYVVQPDNTCEGVANAHGFNATILMMNNPQIDDDCTNLYVGEVLCVASNVQVPPAPAGSVPKATIPATAAPANPTGKHHDNGNNGDYTPPADNSRNNNDNSGNHGDDSDHHDDNSDNNDDNSDNNDDNSDNNDDNSDNNDDNSDNNDDADIPYDQLPYCDEI